MAGEVERDAALKIAREVVETFRERPWQKGSAWPVELFLPLAKEYLEIVSQETEVRDE
jgi:hypothetical protein